MAEKHKDRKTIMPSIKTIYSIIFVLLFFTQFIIVFIPGTTAGNINVGILGMLLLYLLLLCTQFKNMKRFIRKVFSTQLAKYLVFFVGAITLFMIVHILLGHYKAPIYYYAARVYKFYIYTILVFLFPSLGIFLGLKIRDIIKLLFTISLIFFIVGIIQYIGIILNIEAIDFILGIFTNGRDALYLDGGESANKVALRVNSLFGEPSGFGQFIFIFMPIIIFLSKSKYKIYDNVYFNNLVKRIMVLLMLVCLVLTKSPIYLVLCGIEYLFIFFIRHYTYIKKNLLKILIIAVILILVISNLCILLSPQIYETFVGRIVKTVSAFGNFNILVFAEPSLATRIVNYNVQFLSLKYNPLIGAGLYNINIFLNSLYLKISPLPMTKENYMFHYNVRFCTATNQSVVWTSLAEFGILGFAFYVNFVVKVFKNTLQLIKLTEGIEQIFAKGIFYSLISLSIISFYNLSLDSVLIWTIYGIVLAYIYKIKFQNQSSS